ncbi:MAG: urate hydroxylase PuuD [Granulosicoccus sp.]
MSAYLLEWANLLGRWVHMITGIAWIGASFYFIWLDNHLEAPKASEDSEKGVSGELWSVHGGGMYHAQKYQLAPVLMPETLHWFKWEAYTTWITGMFMLALMYWYGAELYLIDPGVADLSKPVAILIGIAVIALGWIAYDWLCKSEMGKNERNLSLIIFAALTLLAFALCQIFSGRGAYMHFGAMLGTIMVGNVFFIIIPGQKDLVQAKAEGRLPDPIHGIRGKQRSVHNTYFTLPVLFVMISNHYAMTYGHKLNWLILIAITLIGALIRVYFVARHKGNASLMPIYAAGAILIAIIALMAPSKPSQAELANTESVDISIVQNIISERCSSCHARAPTQPGFTAAPLGIVFDTREDIVRQAALIHQQTVVTKAMPIGNLTGITDEERSLIDQWYLLLVE